MITNIYLVRHADSTYTPEELTRPLSNKGFKDAEIVTKILLTESITHVVASPYKRAVQTVEGLANTLGLSITLYEEFRERKLAEGPVEDFQASVMKVWQDLEFSFKGGESGNEAQQRGVQVLQRILKEHEGGNIVIGTHGNIMVLIMNYFDESYDYNSWRELQMPDIYKLSFEEGAFIRAEQLWIK
ncbi:histidine phosphatase family protein [Clostridium sp.]|uniref:histidine phosphatase family protein n=1 Tax=Clostridium sp. TaxID=1506 RepID=UPI002FCB7CB9